MKKHFFNVIAALSLVCGVFAFSGCTDFENDINEINNRLDKLETGTIASLEEQIATLTASLDEAHGLIDVLQGNVKDLQDADESMKQQIDVLNGEIETVKGQIADLNSQISTLEDELNKKIDEAVKELEAADLANSQRISDLESSLEDLQKELAAAKEELNGVIAELKEAIAAGDDANKALIDELTKKLNDLTQTVSDLSEQVKDNYDKLLAEIEKAVTELEAADAAAAQRIDGILEDIEGINGELTSLKEDLAEQTQKLADLIETVAGLEEAVDILEGLTANLPELEDLVDSIENNYLSKEEAQNTYATLEQVEKLLEQIGEIDGRLDMLEGLNIGERLTDLEANYKDLNDVVIPGLKDDILAAQNAADEAQKAADAAMDFAKDVLGQLETLRNALGIYAEAGALEAKMEALDAVDSTLKAKDEELAKLIDELDAAVAADIAGLKVSINDLRDELMDIIDDIKADMVTKDDFYDLFMEELNKALAEGGEITEAIAAAIQEARDELQGNIDDANGRIDILDKALKDLSDDVAAVIEDLANRIQSLVFVPEYKDGMATAYRYYVEGTVEGKTETIYVSDNYRLQATFQVTPAGAAEQLVQNPERVKVKVLPVLTRSYAEEDCMVIEDVELTLNPVAGRINVDALIPAEKVTVDNNHQPEITVALYVEDPAVREGEEASDLDNIDAGSYISSEYVAVGLDENASKLEYALFSGEGTEQKVYKNGALVKEEKSWKDAPAPHTFFEGYQLGVKIAESKDAYVSLAQAESDLKLESGALALDYSNTANYYDDSKDAHLEYSKVAAADKGIEYTADGYLISAKMTTEDIKVSKNFRHDSLTVNSYFTKETLLGTPPAPVDVVLLTNKAQYEIINQRYTVELNADGTSQSLETWKYSVAKQYKMTAQDQLQYVFPEVAVVNFEDIQDAEAYQDIRDIIDARNVDVTLTYTVNGTPDTYTGFNGMQFDDDDENLQIEFVAGEIAKIARVTIDSYFFGPQERKYNAVKTYTLEDKGVEVMFNMTFTLGALPAAQNFPLDEDEEFPVDLMLGSYFNWKEIDFEPYYQKIFDSAPEAFKDLKEVKDYLAINYDPDKDVYKYTEMYTRLTPSQQPYSVSKSGDGITKINHSAFFTYLNVVPQNGGNSHGIRLSASDIKSAEDVFNYETTVTTAAGVTYKFTAESKIRKPQISLKYDPVYAPNGKVDVIASIDNNNKYRLPQVDLADYVHVENKDKEIKGNIYAQFEILTKEDAETGYVNIPTLANKGKVDIFPNPSAGENIYSIKELLLDWNNYTARDIEVKVTLWMNELDKHGNAVDGSDIVLDTKILSISTPQPIKSFTAESPSIERTPGETTTIKLWQYLEAQGAYAEDENKNIFKYWEPQTDPKADWREYDELANIAGLNSAYNLAYKYDPVLIFPAQDKITFQAGEGGEVIKDPDLFAYDAQKGTLILYHDNATYQRDLIITIPVELQYYLDKNHVESLKTDLVIVVKASN